MAIGEAMGSAVRGMKPATIKQYFNSMDSYKEVRPFIGKGVKNYRMQGLYGTQTQTALVLCDLFLSKKKMDRDAFLSNLLELKQTGPELYYGMYRRPEACFRRALESVPKNPECEPPEPGIATATFVTVGVIPALYYHGRTKAIVQNSLLACLTLSRKFQELVGTLVAARLVDNLLEIPPESKVNMQWQKILGNAVRFAKEAETELPKILPSICVELPQKTINGVSSAFEILTKEGLDMDEALRVITKHATEKLSRPISHPTQGTSLTLPPIALWMLANCDSFGETLTSTLNLGGESDKLGAIVGALAGAFYGANSIPEAWRSGLVNTKEIKIRGDALATRKKPSKLKPLFEMEAGLTRKEAEERAKFLTSEPKKKLRHQSKANALEEEGENALPERENRKGRRIYEREKSRKKRDRRRNIDWQE